MQFIDAAKALGAWTDDGQTMNYKPSPVSARMMLEVLGFETQIVALIAADMVKCKPISQADKDRLLLAASRISNVSEESNHA